MPTPLVRADTACWTGAILLGVVAAILMAILRDASFLDTDAAQYLSTASNLLESGGLSTDVIYYDEQYGSGMVPAPQTVFPPGMPIMLAAMLAIGASPPLAAFLVGCIAFALTGIFVAVVLRRLGVSRSLALVGSLLWLGLGWGWANALSGRAEVPFALLTLLSAWVAIESRARPRWLLVAGALAGAALLVRLQGVFFVAALAVWSCLPRLQPGARGPRRAMISGTMLVGVPLLVGVGLALRNIALTGGLAGGPVDTVRAGLEVVDVARAAYWMASEFTGLSLGEIASPEPAEWLVMAGMMAVTARLIAGWRRSAGSGGSDDASSTTGWRTAWIALSLAYIAVTLAALIYLAANRAGAYLQGRFLVPLAPFAIVLWMLAVDRWYHESAGGMRRLLVAGLIALHVGLIAGQLEVLRDSLHDFSEDSRLPVMERALAEIHDGLPLRDYLLQRVSRDSPLFAEPGQQLWLLLERPVLGATPSGFSARIWDAKAIEEVRMCHGARLLLFFPQLFDPGRPQNANKAVFIRLANGDIPAFLRPIHRSPQLQLFAIEPIGAGGSCPEPRRPTRRQATQQFALDAGWLSAEKPEQPERCAVNDRPDPGRGAKPEHELGRC